MSFQGLLAHLCFSIDYYAIVRVYHSLFFRVPTEGHIDCFQVLAIMNKDAINIFGQVFVWTLNFQPLWVNIEECDY